MGETGNPRKLLTTMTRNITGPPGEAPYSEGKKEHMILSKLVGVSGC
jgi:hypothetical protein